MQRACHNVSTENISDNDKIIIIKTTTGIILMLLSA